jgi:hypothetical protein
MVRCTGRLIYGEIGQGRRSAQWPCGKGACPQGAVRTGGRVLRPSEGHSRGPWPHSEDILLWSTFPLR